MVDSSILRSSNPYSNAGSIYRKSPWQSFLSSIGMRTEADAWFENMQIQSNEYDAAITQKLYDQQYNEEMYNRYQSPQAQVAQMRAAGLNPDLSPSSIDSGNPLSASPMGEDPSTPMQSSGDESQILGFADRIFSAFTTCIGLTSGVQGLVGNSLQNRLLKFQVDKGDTETGLSLANDLFPLTLPSSPEIREYDDGSVESWRADSLRTAEMLTKHMKPSLRRRVLSNMQAYWNSAPKTAEAWKSWADSVSSEKRYFSESNQFYSSDSEVMHSIYKHLGKAREAVERLKIQSEGQSASADIAEAENREDIANAIDTGLASRAENATNEAKYDDAKIRGILRGTIKDILSDLDRDNSPFAQVFKTLLSVLSFQYL